MANPSSFQVLFHPYTVISLFVYHWPYAYDTLNQTCHLDHDFHSFMGCHLLAAPAP